MEGLECSPGHQTDVILGNFKRMYFNVMQLWPEQDKLGVIKMVIAFIQSMLSYSAVLI